MISDKTKLNIWLVMTVAASCFIVDRVIRLADGRIEWTSLASAVVVFALLLKNYLCTLKKMK